MPAKRRNGATAVVNSTTRASSQSPCRSRPCGPENRSALRFMPAVLTVIRDMRQAMPSMARAARCSASDRPSGSWCVRRSTASQRRQRAVAPAPSAGTTWNRPQSGHSRSRGRRRPYPSRGGAVLRRRVRQRRGTGLASPGPHHMETIMASPPRLSIRPSRLALRRMMTPASFCSHRSPPLIVPRAKPYRACP